ncbi:A/G-specific adenine glycosylase [Thiocystis minor]|uniref:A/G-specific adenine glycosylase n=1 Tax=Thiocystis minor TaxID=61597 RepID=UPI001914C7D4|nr:A/G-specific adenine glycosylase [Thiocystis minor]MBK5964346.1 A/G-specific adenine glycosylase [Thiocystis minor]
MLPSDFTPNDFAAALLSWFDRHGRHDLPWQIAPTPYRVWVSEIMLQQTQVSVVTPYFERFMARFPSVMDLAGAPIDAVLAHWSGLGYYARARNLHRAAGLIRDHYRGIFPTDLAQVQALPGIGRSTAGAILSLAAHQAHPILDGNVKRVLARYFAIDGWPGRGEVLTALWACAERLTPLERVGDYNQGMMDLGATVCTRGKPACERCPVVTGCLACLQGRQREFPASRPRKPLPERDTLMLVAINPAGEILLERRPPTGLWGGLWSLPETAVGSDPADWCLTRFGNVPLGVEMLPARHHTFSHFSLGIRVAAIRIDGSSQQIADHDDRRWLNRADLPAFGLPTPVKAILDALLTGSQQIEGETP